MRRHPCSSSDQYPRPCTRGYRRRGDGLGGKWRLLLKPAISDRKQRCIAAHIRPYKVVILYNILVHSQCCILSDSWVPRHNTTDTAAAVIAIDYVTAIIYWIISVLKYLWRVVMSDRTQTWGRGWSRYKSRSRSRSRVLSLTGRIGRKRAGNGK